MQIYYDQDADLALLQNKKVVILGYGSQGHAHALNLRESGVKSICVALREGSSSIKKAEAEKFKILTPSEAAKWADVVMFLTPDEIQGDIYYKHFHKNMKTNSMLMFAHGFNIHFGIIEAREDMDVVMVAPKGPGHTVRSEYLKGRGVPCLIAIDKDSSGQAKELGLAYASALGGGRSAIIETNFREECETDLFGEQVVLCGGLTELIRSGYEVLVQAGYKPEMAYFECVHEVKLIVDLIYEGGLSNMRYSISNTAEFGDYSVGKRIITNETRKEMRRVLKDIQSGKFAREWMLENKVGQVNFKSMRRNASEHPMEKIGESLRKMMPWLDKDKLVDKTMN